MRDSSVRDDGGERGDIGGEPRGFIEAAAHAGEQVFAPRRRADGLIVAEELAVVAIGRGERRDLKRGVGVGREGAGAIVAGEGGHVFVQRAAGDEAIDAVVDAIGLALFDDLGEGEADVAGGDGPIEGGDVRGAVRVSVVDAERAAAGQLVDDGLAAVADAADDIGAEARGDAGGVGIGGGRFRHIAPSCGMRLHFAARRIAHRTQEPSMPRLTAADELFVHQIPEPLPNVVTDHDHWRESYFFILHPREQAGDVVILTMAHYPKREVMDSLQLGQIDGNWVFGRYDRPYGDDPHTTKVGPVTSISSSRTRRCGCGPSEGRRSGGPDVHGADGGARAAAGDDEARVDEIIWDQSHMIQSGTYSGTYTHNGVTRTVDNWWGQRDHSWGIRDHARCPLWMWLAIQLPDGMLGVWHWEYANGARVYTDGCFAPADGSEPIPVVDFRHELHWTDADGKPADYGKDGAGDGRAGGARRVHARGRAAHRHRCGGHAVRAVRGARRGAAPDVGAHGRRAVGDGDLRGDGGASPSVLPDRAGREPAAGLSAEDKRRWHRSRR